MAISFNHKSKLSIIGTGSYVFRHYGDETVQYTIMYSGLNEYRYIRVDGVLYEGSGSLIVNEGATMTAYSGVNSGSSSGIPKTTNAYIYLNGRQVKKHPRGGSSSYLNPSDCTYTVTIDSNTSVSGSQTGGEYTNNGYVRITTNN